MRAEFHLSNAEYGLILTAFSIAYAASAPFAGHVDRPHRPEPRHQFRRGPLVAGGYRHRLHRGLPGLLGCRAVLGAAEAAGIPAAGKAIHEYLKPAERALGNAVNQAGVSLGLDARAAARHVARASRYGWRQAFVATGVLGLLWIPLWNFVGPAASVPRRPRAPAPPRGILRTRRMWAFIVANALSMVLYSLWTNWTTLFLVEARGLTLVQAAWYAWIPPLAATLGGFAGGWLSLRWIERGVAAPAARTRVCLVAAAGGARARLPSR